MTSFAELVRRLDRDGWEPVRGDVVLVVPEHLERELPFSAPEYRQDIRDNLLQSYVAAREADLPVSLEREVDGFPGGGRLYLAPCAKLLTGPGIDRLRSLAEEGATVYLSYFAGSTTNQRGPWLAWLEEIFGVRHGLRYGLVDPIVDDEIELEMIESFGGLAAGTRLAFRVGGTPSARAYLPVDVTRAEVLAVDGYGRPALLRHAIGAGHTILCTYPLEHLAARTPWANPESTWRIYSALATAAGVDRPVHVDDPRVLVGRLRTGQGELALLVNCSEDALAVDLQTEAAEGTVWRRTLEPFAVETLRLADIPNLDPHDPSTGAVLTVAELSKGGIHTSNLPAVR